MSRHSNHGIESLLDEAVSRGDLPFVVAMWGRADGLRGQWAFGERSTGQKAESETVFRIFSMTKAICGVAAVLLAERELLDLDSPVERYCPRFGSVRVLDGFDGAQPRMRPPRRAATVRHLATHTSGMVYEFFDANVARYLEVCSRPSILSGLEEALEYPLVFDPGEKWGYGPGVDWLGRIVECVDGRPIDAFCHEEIFEPLGMTDTRFELEPSLRARLAWLKLRGPTGKFEDFDLAPPSRPQFYGMGHALYSTAPDYMRFLRMILNDGELDGKRLLSGLSVSGMLENAIGPLRVEKLLSVAPSITADVELLPGAEKSHGLVCMRNESDVSGMRTAGAQGWAGVGNTHYWFDPARDVAALFMTQCLPFADPRVMSVYSAFEQAVYRDLDSSVG